MNKYPLMSKLLVIGFLMVLLAIPLMMVRDVIQERSLNREAATQEVARALGKRRMVIPMPVPLISLVAGVSEAIRLPFPVATDQLRQLALDNIGATDAVERELGFVPRDMGGRLSYLRRKISQQ
mgnify:CR=1 FL=1